MCTIANRTRKGWHNVDRQPFALYQHGDIRVNSEILNNKWEPKLYLDDLFRKHPQFRQLHKQRGEFIPNEIDSNLISPPMTDATWGVPEVHERRKATSDCHSNEDTPEDRLPHVQMVSIGMKHPLGMTIPMTNVHERGCLFDNNTLPAPEKEGLFHPKAEPLWLTRFKSIFTV